MAQVLETGLIPGMVAVLTGDSGSDPGTGEPPGGDTGSGPDPALYDFTDATYNAALHDYNGDGLVDDSNGDGVPDDRDGDGFPNGLWGGNDYPRSAGPGFTLPPNSSFCYGYNGNLVATGVAGRTYYLDADDGIAFNRRQPMEATASTQGVLRFSGDFLPPNFSHGREDNSRAGYLSRYDDFRSFQTFYWDSVPSCLIPPWLNP